MPTSERARLRAAIERIPPSREGIGPEVRLAAVSLIFSPGPAGLELLMIRRAEDPRDPWSGHMAFPGGRRDPGDPDLEATAIRETWEELGLALPPPSLLGPLAPLRSPVRPHRDPLVIQPFVFVTDHPLPPLHPNAREVAGIHRFALNRLAANEGRAVFPWLIGGEPVKMPCILMDGCTIWGLSLRMIDDLLERLGAD